MADPTGRISHLPEMHRGVSWKQPVRAATTADIAIESALNDGDSIDGVTLATDDRVLVKDQTDASENGIYRVSVTPFRAYDMDQDATTTVPASEVVGSWVYVVEGAANGGTVWYVTTTTPPELNVDDIDWARFTGPASLDDIPDVNAPAPDDGDVLTWDDGAGEWIASAVGGITVEEIDASPSVGAVTTMRVPSDSLTDDTGGQVTYAPKSAVEVIIDGGGSAITTGVKADVEMPFAGTIRSARLFADQTGSIVVDLWKDAYANFPPTVADTITASAKPSLSSAVASQDTTLTGWATSFAKGDIIRINVDSASTLERVTLALVMERNL